MPEYICPHCLKPIYDDEALLCLYCGESLGRSTGFLGAIKRPKPKVIIIILVLLLLITFLILMIR